MQPHPIPAHDGNDNEQRDHPLSFHWHAPTLVETLGLSLERKQAQALNAILTEAILLNRADPERWISYSRRRAFYSETSRYRSTSFTYRTVTWSVDLAIERGLLDGWKAPANSYGKRQSTLRAAKPLTDMFANRALAVTYDPFETLILRDREGNSVSYRDTDQTRAIRKKTDEINEALAATSIGHPNLGTVRPGDPIAFRNASAGLARNQLTRIFTEGFNRHGRFYGGWWQNIPKQERERLTIDGHATDEIDFPRLHITMAYARAGMQLTGDPYDISPWPVALVKRAVNVALNARTRTAALRSIASEMGGEGAFSKADALLTAIEQRHAPIADLLFSDAGMILMNDDAAITERIMLDLIRKGIVALPVHDSFRAASDKSGGIIEAMAAAMQGYFTRVSRSGGITNRPTVPQMVPAPSGDGVGDGALAFVVMPDLFGGDDVSVPFPDLDGWRGGVMPRSVANAVRHAAHFRGLTHDDLAHAVGLSRKHLTNALNRVFGVRPDVADALRAFLLNEAVTVRGYAKGIA